MRPPSLKLLAILLSFIVFSSTQNNAKSSVKAEDFSYEQQYKNKQTKTLTPNIFHVYEKRNGNYYGLNSGCDITTSAPETNHEIGSFVYRYNDDFLYGSNWVLYENSPANHEVEKTFNCFNIQYKASGQTKYLRFEVNDDHVHETDNPSDDGLSDFVMLESFTSSGVSSIGEGESKAVYIYNPASGRYLYGEEPNGGSGNVEARTTEQKLDATLFNIEGRTGSISFQGRYGKVVLKYLNNSYGLYFKKYTSDVIPTDFTMVSENEEQYMVGKEIFRKVNSINDLSAGVEVTFVGGSTYYENLYVINSLNGGDGRSARPNALNLNLYEQYFLADEIDYLGRFTFERDENLNPYFYDRINNGFICSGDNGAFIIDTLSDHSRWNISFDADGKLTAQTLSGSKRNLCYNSLRFNCVEDGNSELSSSIIYIFRRDYINEYVVSRSYANEKIFTVFEDTFNQEIYPLYYKTSSGTYFDPLNLTDEEISNWDHSGSTLKITAIPQLKGIVLKDHSVSLEKGDNYQVEFTKKPYYSPENVYYELNEDEASNYFNITQDGFVTCISDSIQPGHSDTYRLYIYSESGQQLTWVSLRIKRLEWISISKHTGQKIFNIGDSFNYEGLEISAQYSTGYETLTDGFQISSPNMNIVGLQTVTVTYKGLEASYDIFIKNPQDSTNDIPYEKITWIEIHSYPTQNIYRQGSNFSYEGLTLLVHCNDSTSYVIDSGFTVDTPDMTRGGLHSVTVSYFGMTDTFPIAVSTHEMILYVGETISIEEYLGMTIESNFMTHMGSTNESIATVDNNFNITGIAQGEVFLMNLQRTLVIYATVIESQNQGNQNPEPTLIGIELVTPPNNQYYWPGDNFNYEGLTIRLLYSDESANTVISQGLNVSQPNMNQTGQQNVTVSYGGYSTQFGIFIKTPHPIELNVGESYDLRTFDEEFNNLSLNDIEFSIANPALISRNNWVLTGILSGNTILTLTYPPTGAREQFSLTIHDPSSEQGEDSSSQHGDIDNPNPDVNGDIHQNDENGTPTNNDGQGGVGEGEGNNPGTGVNEPQLNKEDNMVVGIAAGGTAAAIVIGAVSAITTVSIKKKRKARASAKDKEEE